MREKLLKAPALQVGSKVSHQEIRQTIGSHGKSVDKYIDPPEKPFVVFGVRAYSRNVLNDIR